MPNVYQTGKAAAQGIADGKFLKISEGEAILIVPLVGLDEMVSTSQHEFWDIQPAVITPCVGKNCPACSLGNKPKFKAFLPIQTKDGSTKIYAFGIKIYRQFEEIESELGTIKAKVIKVRRSGQGRMTNYTLIATGKAAKIDNVEVPDVIGELGEVTIQTITTMLEERGLIEKVTKTQQTQQAKQKAKPAVIEEDEEEVPNPAVAAEDGWENA